VVPYQKSLSDHYQHLAAAERLSGHPAEAATAAMERRNLWPDDPGELFSVACDLALCIPLGGQPAIALPANPQAAVRRYDDLAMDTLRQAIARGFKDIERLKTSPELGSLRGREDFRLILSDLAFPTDPFVP
jgi:hypothetical protein